MQAVAGGRGRCGEGCRRLLEVIMMKPLTSHLYQWKWKSTKSRLDRSLSSFWHRSVPHFRDVFFCVRANSGLILKGIGTFQQKCMTDQKYDLILFV